MKARLDAWRDATRRRDELAVGTPEWQEGEAEIERVAKVFHAAEAQAFVRYAEEEYQDQHRPRFAQSGRLTARADDLTER